MTNPLQPKHDRLDLPFGLYLDPPENRAKEWGQTHNANDASLPFHDVLFARFFCVTVEKVYINLCYNRKHLAMILSTLIRADLFVEQVNCKL